MIQCQSRQIINEITALSHNFCIVIAYCATGWWRGSVVERRSLAGELSLSCARPAADG